MHHVEQPSLAIGEMLRVARTAVFLSDSNRFDQGPRISRVVKRFLAALDMWPIVNRLKTRGKGYAVSDGEGLAYSHSVFDNYRKIRCACRSVHPMNTLSANISLFRTSPHVALFGIK